jgi:hypothetical protein
MTARRGVVAALAVALLVSGCSATIPVELDDLRARFIEAGGTCSTWSAVSESGTLAVKACAEGAVLMVFANTEGRADFIKTEIETNPGIRGRTHIILSSDTWLVIDRIASVVRVMPALGGMISGRNGANP